MLNPIYKMLIPATVLSLVALTVYGQVKSGAYRLMLNGLLSHSVPEINVQELAQNQDAYLLLDAREPREYEVSHLESAIPVGYDHFSLEQLPEDLSKNQPIVVYCSVGYRSEKVAEKLRQAGFTQVSNLYGGIFEWVNQDHPVLNQSGPTTDIHGYSRSWAIWLRKGKKVFK